MIINGKNRGNSHFGNYIIVITHKHILFCYILLFCYITNSILLESLCVSLIDCCWVNLFLSCKVIDVDGICSLVFLALTFSKEWKQSVVRISFSNIGLWSSIKVNQKFMLILVRQLFYEILTIRLVVNSCWICEYLILVLKLIEEIQIRLSNSVKYGS